MVLLHLIAARRCCATWTVFLPPKFAASTEASWHFTGNREEIRPAWQSPPYSWNHLRPPRFTMGRGPLSVEQCANRRTSHPWRASHGSIHRGSILDEGQCNSAAKDPYATKHCLRCLRLPGSGFFAHYFGLLPPNLLPGDQGDFCRQRRSQASAVLLINSHFCDRVRYWRLKGRLLYALADYRLRNPNRWQWVAHDV